MELSANPGKINSLEITSQLVELDLGGNFLFQMLISSKLGLGEKILPIPLPGIITDALAKLLRPLFRSFQSTYYLLPRASLWKDTVIVETPNHKYTANDYESLLRDLGFPEGYDMFHGIEDISMWRPPHPSVPTHCFYSKVNVPIMSHLSK